MDRALKKANDFLKDQKLLAVRFDKGCGYCVMKPTTYLDKLNEILISSQFEPRNGESDYLTIRTEKLINSSLHQLKTKFFQIKPCTAFKKIYHMLRTTGSQPARLYGLAKYIKLVLHFGLFCQYPVAVTRSSINFSLPFSVSYQVQILRLTRKMPEQL